MPRPWLRLGVLLLASGLLLAGCGTSPAQNVSSSPAAPPLVAPPPQAATLLDLVNQARGSARSCGTTPYAAAAPLSLDARLTQAAQLHSEDMQTHDDFSHTGSDGSTLAQRVEAQGYSYSWLGEDIAYGFTTASSVMTAWLQSPGHCANIMSPHFTNLGTGVAGTYWTLDFGAPP